MLTDGTGIIILVTGIMASGKSTVAQLLSERFEQSVHLRGDLFRRMIVNNRKEVEPDAEDHVLEQLRLRYQLAAQAADTYCKAGFTVVVQDVVIGKMLNDFVSFIHSRPFYVVVLCPNTAAVAEREANRTKKGYGSWTVTALNDVLRNETPPIGLWLDSSAWTPDETVQEIVKRLDEARI
ncbi:phosphotransferase-like protein [Paenibacillus spongiae]|uniref:AAA family ATPase n=1 Tax=Paenibacillus spongiae TaxID=2909671 RepID=A0ABY5SGG1_9BACL|nr:AAA family ATPase [Paenibacillus spongiae]UVI33031.1 AAA family ATPase [Paenibacillus spongiae]